MKKFNILLLIFSFFCLINSTVFASHYPNKTDSSSLKINNHFTNNQKTILSNISKQTSLSNEDIYTLLDKGLSENEIKECYTITFFSDKSINDISIIFLSENDIYLTLKDLNINTKDFEEKFNKLFPDDFNIIFRNNIPWRQAPLSE